jgi:2-polyprenyl-3-methyl-5-hydroxy-6-metoxy-1,4-benzoquinol methylase
MSKCYLCNDDNVSVIRTKLRRDIERDILSCNKCGFIYLRPNNDNLGKYYGTDYRNKYTPSIDKQYDSDAMFNASLPLQKRRIERSKHLFNKKSNVLEVGASSGHFSYAIKDMVATRTIIELNLSDAEYIRQKQDIPVYTTPIEETDLPKESFDGIFAFQMLEHVPDPRKFLATLAEYVKPGGFIHVEVPNINDALLSAYKLNKGFADFYFREPHLYYYSIDTLKEMLFQSGFDGDTSTCQDNNFLNTVNWIQNDKPQENVQISQYPPELVSNNEAPDKIKEKLNKWILGVDREYQSLLNSLDIGDVAVFLGTKKIP